MDDFKESAVRLRNFLFGENYNGQNRVGINETRNTIFVYFYKDGFEVPDTWEGHEVITMINCGEAKAF